MSGAVYLLPLALSAVGWWGLNRLNKRTGWFRIGEIIFWNCILTIIVFLIWLALE